MKVNTKANVGDRLFYVINPMKGDNKYSVKQLKVREVKVYIMENEYFEVYEPEFPFNSDDLKYRAYINNNYINDGEYSGVFLKKEDAEKKAEYLSEELRKELEEQKEYDKKSKKENAIFQIQEIAKKNKIKIEIKNEK